MRAIVVTALFALIGCSSDREKSGGKAKNKAKAAMGAGKQHRRLVAGPVPRLSPKEVKRRKGVQFFTMFAERMPWTEKLPGADVFIGLVDYRADVGKSLKGKQNRMFRLFADSQTKEIAALVEIFNVNALSSFKPNPIQFRLKEPGGGRYESGHSVALTPDLSSSAIGPGEHVKGWITFKVPRNINSDACSLRYENFNDEPLTKWIPLRLADYRVSDRPEYKKIMSDIERELGMPDSQAESDKLDAKWIGRAKAFEKTACGCKTRQCLDRANKQFAKFVKDGEGSEGAKVTDSAKLKIDGSVTKGVKCMTAVRRKLRK